MVLKLYGYVRSSNTKLAAAVLHEKKVPYEFILIDLAKGEHKSPQHLEKHPFGQVPYIDDDGFILFEAHAIARYIATKYANEGPKLIPTDLKGYALFEQAASIESSNFAAPAYGIIYEKIISKLFGKDTDAAAVEKHRSTLDSKLEVIDKILSKQKYLAGDEVTLADLFVLPYATWLPDAEAGDLIDKRPNVKRWLDDISARASWQAVKDGKLGSA